MNAFRMQTRKLFVGFVVAGGLLLSSVIGFGADDAGARTCVQGGVSNQTTYTCYNSEIDETYFW